MTSTASNDPSLRRWRPLAIMSIVAVMMFLLVGTVVLSPRLILACFGFAALLIVITPVLFQRRYDFFSPWTFVVVTVFIGVTVRSFLIALGWPSRETVDDLFLLGQPVEALFSPTLTLLMGLFALQLGYFTARRRSSAPRGWVSRARLDWSARRLAFTIVGFTAIWAVALYLFVNETGGLNLERLSAKRTVVRNLQEYTAHGYLRWLDRFSFAAFVLTLSHFAYGRRRLLGWRLGVLGLLFLASATLSVYASSRTQLMWQIITAFALWYCAGRSVNVALVGGTGLVGLVAFQTLTVMRRAAASHEGLLESNIVFGALETLALNRNLLDLARTAHIINSVPGLLEFEYGKTLLTWLYAPIPRQLWEDKPVVGIGLEVGSVIYGLESSERGGISPGVVGELYWNFWWPGVVLGCALLGWFLRCAYEWCRVRSIENPNVVLLYVVGVMPAGFIALGETFSQAVIQVITDVVPVLVGLYLVSGGGVLRKRRAQSVARGLVPA